MRLATVFILTLLLSGCTDDDQPVKDPYAFETPSNFPSPVYTFENNPVSKRGVELGQMLFYDPVLSLDSSIACANCHQQAVAFSDPVHRFSRGVDNAAGFRNAPAIQNMAFQNNFFWDGGVKHLDFVPINAVTSKIEMAETLEHVVSKLNRSSFYPQKFKAAFGGDEITSQQMLYALSQFMNLMISANAKYDKHVRGDEHLTAEEAEGLELFENKCRVCHATDLFTDDSFRNNGLDASFEKDSGRERITEFEGDRGKFKVPGLRNVALTSPYMHDGRFNTLQQVLDHYASNVKNSETLDPVLKQGESLGIRLSEQEKLKLIAFLNTLSDNEFTHDKRFANPFVK